MGLFPTCIFIKDHYSIKKTLSDLFPWVPVVSTGLLSGIIVLSFVPLRLLLMLPAQEFSLASNVINSIIISTVWLARLLKHQEQEPSRELIYPCRECKPQ